MAEFRVITFGVSETSPQVPFASPSPRPVAEIIPELDPEVSLTRTPNQLRSARLECLACPLYDLNVRFYPSLIVQVYEVLESNSNTAKIKSQYSGSNIETNVKGSKQSTRQNWR